MIEIEGAGQSGTGLDGPGGAVVVGGDGVLSQTLATDVLMADLTSDQKSKVASYRKRTMDALSS